MKRVAIVDYGSGNIASLDQAFTAIGASTFLLVSSRDLRGADALVLPGVGHFGAAAQALRSSGLEPDLIASIRSGLPTLGICLGFQLLTASSEEASGVPGLDLLPLRTVRIKPENCKRHKVPHLGWNSIHSVGGHPRLLLQIPDDRQLFFYANAYAVIPAETLTDNHATYEHERPWLALVEHHNIHGVQFHPEKSRRQGLQLLRNFLRS